MLIAQDDYQKRSVLFWTFNQQIIYIYNIRKNQVLLRDEQQRLGKFLSFLDCYNPKLIRIIISLLKKINTFMLIKEQNSSNQSSLVIDENSFLSKSQVMYLIFTRMLMVVLTFKNTWFLKDKWSIELCYYLSLNLLNLLLSASEEKTLLPSTT